jgi:hypothetical protein
VETDWGGSVPTCPAEFHLNPKDTDRDTFLRQFKPCGYYKANCRDSFDGWFPNTWTDAYDGLNDPFDAANALRANVDYPGNGDQDLQYGVNLVQFDIGLDAATYAAYQDLAEEYGEDLIDDTGSARYLDFENALGETGEPLWTSAVRPMALGETCVETFARTNQDWGKINEDHDSVYDSMGTCGAGHAGLGYAKDCMKHDVCSYFKGAALGIEPEGFCADFDCGDEAAQTVMNCWTLGENVICNPDLHEDSLSLLSNGIFSSSIHASARLAMGQKRKCTLRSGYERGQGIPWQRYPDGTVCTSPDDCISRRCDGILGTCQDRVEVGESCNEDSDCISVQCDTYLESVLNGKCIVAN